MSDTAFVLGMAAIVAVPFVVAVAADAYDAAKFRREVMNRPVPCFRWHCHNPAIEGKAFCADCIADMDRKGIKV